MAERTVAVPLHRWKLLLLLAVFVAACNPMRGCAESSFQLAPESRLPKWFALAQGQSRLDVELTMTYYLGLDSRSRATFVLRDRDGRKVAAVEGLVRDNQPQTLTPAPSTSPLPYPSYEVVTINGITEIIEHRRMEPIFYINDDPEVKRRLGISN